MLCRVLCLFERYTFIVANSCPPDPTLHTLVIDLIGRGLALGGMIRGAAIRFERSGPVGGVGSANTRGAIGGGRWVASCFGLNLNGCDLDLALHGRFRAVAIKIGRSGSIRGVAAVVG